MDQDFSAALTYGQRWDTVLMRRTPRNPTTRRAPDCLQSAKHAREVIRHIPPCVRSGWAKVDRAEGRLQVRARELGFYGQFFLPEGVSRQHSFERNGG
jgi:hypothetical protein